MNRNLVIQRDNSQNFTLKLLDFARIPKPVPLLRFTSKRILQNLDAPLLFQIGSLTQYLVLEIFREPVLWHRQRIARFSSDD